jgi:hypothetical protein
VLLQIPPAENASHAHRIVQNGNRQTRHADRRRNEDVHPTNSGNEQHRAAHGRQQDGGAAIRFNKNQAEHCGNQQTGHDHAAFPSLHQPLAVVAIPSEHDDERELGKFGGLQAHSGKDEPAVCAVDVLGDAMRQRQQHRHEQHKRNNEKRQRRFFEQLIVEGGRRHAQSEAERTPDELQHQIMRANLGHARAVKHHQPQRQQGGNAERQSCDGDFHFNVSKPAADFLWTTTVRSVCQRARALPRAQRPKRAQRRARALQLGLQPEPQPEPRLSPKSSASAPL